HRLSFDLAERLLFRDTGNSRTAQLWSRTEQLSDEFETLPRGMDSVEVLSDSATAEFVRSSTSVTASLTIDPKDNAKQLTVDILFERDLGFGVVFDVDVVSPSGERRRYGRMTHPGGPRSSAWARLENRRFDDLNPGDRITVLLHFDRK